MAGRHLNTDATVIYAISFASISLVGAILVVRKTMVLQSEAELKAKPGDPVILAAKNTTRSIPIVMASVGDPVGRGCIERPHA